MLFDQNSYRAEKLPISMTRQEFMMMKPRIETQTTKIYSRRMESSRQKTARHCLHARRLIKSNFSCFHALQTRAPVILDSTFFSCFARLYHRRTFEKLFKPYVSRFDKFSPQRNHLCGNPKTFYGSIRSGNRN